MDNQTYRTYNDDKVISYSFLSLLDLMLEVDRVTYLFVWVDTFFQGCVVANLKHWYGAFQRGEHAFLIEKLYQIIYLVINIHHGLDFRHIGKRYDRGASLLDLENVGEDLW